MSAFNFYAGPAILPKQVLNQASNACKSFDEFGLSILEISHRGKAIVAVMEETEELIRKLLGLTDDFAVLFLTGGASSQFYMTAMNLLNKRAAFVDTGTWSTKSLKEAAQFGEVDIVASSKDDNYTHFPKDYTIAPDTDYLHLTSNNTVCGTQLHRFPDVDVPIVCDMSSDIMSRPLPIEKFGLIYAGAQKNFGPAGTTLVIVRKDLLGKVDRTIPTMLDYQTHVAKNSAFNTPPVFPIYVSMLVCKWLIEQGGLSAMEEKNKTKAALLYDTLDNSNGFYGTTVKEDRSLMNVTFKLRDEDKTADFINFAQSNGCIGLKGHRSVGGCRASIYNAMPHEGVVKLTEIIKEFDS